MKTAKKQYVTSDLIDWLMETLECPQRAIANLMGVDPHTLSNNRKLKLNDVSANTRARLVNLFKVVQHIGALKTDAMMDVLQRHVFEDEMGRRDSVVSALQQAKYPLDTLLEIAELAKAEQHEQFVAASPNIARATVPA